MTEGFERSLPYFAAYGWKNALKLAKTPGDAAQQQVAQRNADSIALFASAVRLLNLGSVLQRPTRFVTDNGNVVTQNPVSRRALVPREIEHPTTPAAFESFMTLIRAERAERTSI